MPEWTAPFKRPHMPTAKFKKAQKDYVAKYGYRYSIPGFDDVVSVGFENPMTKQEQKDWRNKHYSKFSPERYEEIKYMKHQRKERFLDMLGSPTPSVFQDRASILTAMDNVQDAASVVSTLGIVAANYAPRSLAKLISGPLGWIAGGAEVLDMMMKYVVPESALRHYKHTAESMTRENPFCKKARAKNIERIAKSGLHKGLIAEGLQVTHDVFGKGITLGGLMSLPLAIISGAARRAMGQKVTVNYPIPNIPIWKKRILRAVHSAPAMSLTSLTMSAAEKTMHYITTAMSIQHSQVHGSIWSPLDHVDDSANVEIEAPTPWHVLTQEVIQEVDPGAINAIGWPSTGKRWSTINEIAETSADTTQSDFASFLRENKRNWEGYITGSAASIAAQYMLSDLADDGKVEYDYINENKVMVGMLSQNMFFDQQATDAQREKLKSYIESFPPDGPGPTSKDVMLFAKNIIGLNVYTGRLKLFDASQFMQENYPNGV